MAGTWFHAESDTFEASLVRSGPETSGTQNLTSSSPQTPTRPSISLEPPTSPTTFAPQGAKKRYGESLETLQSPATKKRRVNYDQDDGNANFETLETSPKPPYDYSYASSAFSSTSFSSSPWPTTYSSNSPGSTFFGFSPLTKTSFEYGDLGADSHSAFIFDGQAEPVVYPSEIPLSPTSSSSAHLHLDSPYDLADSQARIAPLVYERTPESSASGPDAAFAPERNTSATVEDPNDPFRASLPSNQEPSAIEPEYDVLKLLPDTFPLPDDPALLKGMSSMMNRDLEAFLFALGGGTASEVVELRCRQRSLPFPAAAAEALLSNAAAEEFFARCQWKPYTTNPADPRYSSVFREVFPDDSKPESSSTPSHSHSEAPSDRAAPISDYAQSYLVSYEFADPQTAIDCVVEAGNMHFRSRRQVGFATAILGTLPPTEPVCVVHARHSATNGVPSGFFGSDEASGLSGYFADQAAKRGVKRRVFCIVPARVVLSNSRDAEGKRRRADLLTQETPACTSMVSTVNLATMSPLNVTSGGSFNGRYVRPEEDERFRVWLQRGLQPPLERQFVWDDPTAHTQRCTAIANILHLFDLLWDLELSNGVKIAGRLGSRPSMALIERVIAEARNVAQLVGWDGVLEAVVHKDINDLGLAFGQLWGPNGCPTAQAWFAFQNGAMGPGVTPLFFAHLDYYLCFAIRTIDSADMHLVNVLSGMFVQALLNALSPISVALHGDLPNSAADRGFITRQDPAIIRFIKTPNQDTTLEAVQHVYDHLDTIPTLVVKPYIAQVGQIVLHEIIKDEYAAFFSTNLHEGQFDHEQESWAELSQLFDLLSIGGATINMMNYSLYRADGTTRKSFIQLLPQYATITAKMQDDGVNFRINAAVENLARHRKECSLYTSEGCSTDTKTKNDEKKRANGEMTSVEKMSATTKKNKEEKLATARLLLEEWKGVDRARASPDELARLSAAVKLIEKEKARDDRAAKKDEKPSWTMTVLGF